jgi:hypothetical protein
VLYLVLVRAAGVTTIAGVRYVPTLMHVAAPYALWPADRSPDSDAGEAAALVAGLLDGANAITSDPEAPIDLGCRAPVAP